MVVVEHCVSVITLIYLCSQVGVTSATTLQQHRRGGHLRRLPEWPTHAEDRLAKTKGGLVDIIPSGTKAGNLRLRRQHGQSTNQQHSAYMVFNDAAISDDQSELRTDADTRDDQSELAATQPSPYQRVIEEIFTFPNSKPKPKKHLYHGGEKILKAHLSSKPNCARGSEFCSNYEDDYPTGLIESLVSENIDEWIRFNTEDVLTSEEQDIIDRGDDEPKPIQLCKSEVNKLNIEKAQGANNARVFVVQTEQVKQTVRVEVCKGNHLVPCNKLLTAGIADHYITQCKQKYIVREMLVLGSMSGEPVIHKAPVMLPSCCLCEVTEDAGYNARTFSNEVGTLGVMNEDNRRMGFQETNRYTPQEDYEGDLSGRRPSHRSDGRRTEHEVHANMVMTSRAPGRHRDRFISFGISTLVMVALWLCQ